MSVSTSLLVGLLAVTTMAPGVPPRPPEHGNPSPEALARKARSEARLRREGVPISKNLPVIDTESEARIRTRAAVVDRAIALMIVALKGEGLEQAQVTKAVDSFSAAKLFTPKEKEFLDEPRPDKRARAQFAWRYECLSVLLWALSYSPAVGDPGKIVDAGNAVGALVKPGPKKFREGARLRSAREILDEADLIYRYDWACVDARVSGKPAPRGVDCEIVVERHHALNWLIGYQGQDWDDVSTDT
jgi:hypothetical protein